VEEYLLPNSNKLHLSLLKTYGRGVVNTNVTTDDLVNEWRQLGYTELMIAIVEQIFKFIDSKGFVGATLADIKQWRKEKEEGDCMAVVKEMEKFGLILREGIGEPTWVSLRHSHPWLVHTQKISRIQRQGIRLQGMYQMENDSCHPTTPAEAPVEGSEHQDNENNDEEEGEDSEVEQSEKRTAESEGEEEVSGPPSKLIKLEQTANTSRAPNVQKGKQQSERTVKEFGYLRSRYHAMKRRSSNSTSKVDKESTDEMERKAFDNSELRESISVSMRPWVRIHGSLNRRVLDRMLGTVLFTVMENPGVCGNDVARKLCPAIQPVHIFELLSMLKDLGCVDTIAQLPLISKSPGLFDDMGDYYSEDISQKEQEEAGPEEGEDNTLYIPTVDCVTRLCCFIGDKKYAQDFLCGNRF